MIYNTAYNYNIEKDDSSFFDANGNQKRVKLDFEQANFKYIFNNRTAII